MAKGTWKKTGCMAMCATVLMTGGWHIPMNNMQVFAESTNVLDNSAFAESVGSWYATSGDGSAKLEFVNDGNGYGKDGYVKVTGRTATWNSLAQNITNKVVNGKKYKFSCWVKLGEEYTAESEVKVGLTVVSTGDNEGNPQYDVWNLSGNKIKASKDEWRKVEGSFMAKWNGDLSQVEFKVADESCTNDFYVDDIQLTMDDTDRSVQKDIPSLKKHFQEKGYKFRFGGELTGNMWDDDGKMELAGMHYNTITAGNELKPDSIFRGLDENGDIILNFSNADRALQKVWDYNEGKAEEDKIHMRAHVLTWHSQTPDAFFKDKDGNYLSKEDMTKRQEEYIKQVTTHVQDKYPGLVYCWDVVNEAINPGDGLPGGLRKMNGDRPSGYYQIFGESNEYIINAFRFANKYVDPSVKLFYNDYGDTDKTKMKYICDLLDAVKAHANDAEYPTRIDGMGMQAHYSMESPSGQEVYTAIKTYNEHVDEVQLTEIDVAATRSYDGSEAQKEAEQQKEAYKYKELFDGILKAYDEGANITAVVFWGVSDDDSWLLSPSQSGGRHNMPLLFDENLKAKPSYWALVDATKLAPSIKEKNVLFSSTKDWTKAEEVTIGNNGSTMKLVWKDGALCAQVKVNDATNDAEDKVTLFLDEANAKLATADGIRSIEVKRADGVSDAEGYTVEAELPIEKGINGVVGFDAVITDAATGAQEAWNDYQLTQAAQSKYYGILTLKPYMMIPMGSAVIDGEADEAWAGVEAAELTVGGSATDTTATVKTMWDKEFLYVYADIKDSCLNKDNANAWEQDSFEIFLDENNAKTDAYEADDCQYRINFDNELSFNGTNCNAQNIESATKRTENGYVVEAKVRFNNTVEQELGKEIGIDYQINEADASGVRKATRSWFDATGMGYAKPAVFGTAALTEANKAEEPAEPEKVSIETAKVTGIKDVAYTGKALTQKLTVTVDGKKLVEKKDYTVTYKNNTKVGTATVTIKGCGAYEGTVTKTFKITKAVQKIKVATTSYTKCYGDKAFELKGVKGEGKLTYSSSDKKVATVSEKGKVTIKGYGKAVITVKAAGNDRYSSAKAEIKIKVVPNKLKVTAKAAKKAGTIELSWKADKSVSGYEIRYAVKGEKTFKTVKVNSAKAASKTLSKLKAKKNYTVQIRAYKKTTKAGTAYGDWSVAKNVRTK